MATSRLTGRTLALATVALVLACGKAAIGQPERVVPRQPSSAGPRPAGIVPGAPVRGSSVGTFTHTGSGGGSSRVGTITASRGGSGGSVVTVQGDRRPAITRAGAHADAATRPGTQLARRPGGRAAKPGPGKALAHASDPGVMVKRIVIGGEPAPAPKEMPVEPLLLPSDPRLRAALRTAAPPPALTRNAFSIGAASVGQISPP